MLVGKQGQYALFSNVQKYTGPGLYDPFFGFAYLGSNANIRVSVVINQAIKFDLAQFTTSPDWAWNYFSKNLSSVMGTSTGIPLNTQWQVCEILPSQMKRPPEKPWLERSMSMGQKLNLLKIIF